MEAAVDHLVEVVVDRQAEVQEDQAVEAAVDHQAEVLEQVQAGRQCVQVERQYVEVDKCGHVAHHVVYLREMLDV